MTFNRVMKFIEENFGFTIINKRKKKNGKQYRYKLIVDFDEDFIEGN